MHCYFLFCACCWPAAAEQPARCHPIPRKDLLRQIRLRRRQLPVPRSPKSFRMMKFRSSSKPSGGSLPADAEIDQDAALALAMENAGVPEKDAYNVKVERDRENDIPIFQVEFETEYGNYDFEIAITGGKIIGADYEVDEEWLDRLGGSPVTLEEAKQAVQSKVPASSTENIRMWEESGDGRGRFEGELFHDGIKYEFEIDPKTGIIFDWNADLRE